FYLTEACDTSRQVARGSIEVTDSLTSLSLLQRVRDRDPESWTRLLHLYGPLILDWCRGCGVRGADAEDIRQEVFQSVAAHLGTFRRDRPGDTFRGWQRVIARRKILDLLRRRKTQPDAAGGSEARRRLLQVPDPADPDADDTPEQ